MCIGSIFLEIVNGQILISSDRLHGPSMFAVEGKNYGALYNKSSSIAFDETLNYWSAPKTS